MPVLFVTGVVIWSFSQPGPFGVCQMEQSRQRSVRSEGLEALRTPSAEGILMTATCG